MGLVEAPPDSLRARYASLLAVAESISRHRNLAALIKQLSAHLKQVVEFDFLGLSLYDPAARTLRRCVLETEREIHDEAPAILPVEETLGGAAVLTERPLYRPRLEPDPRYPLSRKVFDWGIRSYCALPLMTPDRCIGALSFGSVRESAYSSEDIEFMSQAARQVAVAVESAENFDAAASYQADLQRERDRLHLLLEVNNAAVKHLEMDGLFRSVGPQLREHLNLDYVSLLLYDADSNKLRLELLDFPAGRGVIREGMLIDVDGTLPGQAILTRVPVVARGGEIATLGNPLVEAEKLRSLCAVPLVTPRGTLGSLGFGSLREDAFEERDVQLLAQVAGQIAIALDNALSYRRIEVLNEHLAQEKLYLEDEIRTERQFEEIVGESRALRAVLSQIETVAPTDSTVLISGETGTGKELVARSVHGLSKRSRRAFVKLNCAAIPTGLLESELFGHEKGAFTGAIAQRVGRFELANGGTIFLDEIGEIPLDLQPKLLRVLQEREFERLGSSRTLRTDARLVAATNADLATRVEQGLFRADLYYRLNVFPIRVPSLAERPEDIPLLVRYFAQQFARRMNRRFDTIPSATMEALVAYPWPGNVRELQNLIERAVIVSPGPVLRVPLADHVGRALESPRKTDTLNEADRKHILAALEETGWVLGGAKGAAARLGLKRSTLQFRMKKLGIERPRT